MNNARNFVAFDPPAVDTFAASVPSDEIELRLARAGDEKAFTALYRRHSAAVFRFAWLLTGSEALAADVTQETFIGLLEAPDSYDPTRGSLTAYLCGIARFRAYRATDTRMRAVDDIAELAERNSDGDAPDLPDETLERSQALQRLYAAVRRLPAPFREVLILVELQEMSYVDAAATAGIELGTVRSRLSRAKARLALMLKEHEVACDE